MRNLKECYRKIIQRFRSNLFLKSLNLIPHKSKMRGTLLTEIKSIHVCVCVCTKNKVLTLKSVQGSKTPHLIDVKFIQLHHHHQQYH